MKKRIMILLTAVLVIGLLAALLYRDWDQPKVPNAPQIDKAKLWAISDAWVKEYDCNGTNPYRISPAWYHIDGWGSYYLGSENGYDIFYLLNNKIPNSPIIDMGDGDYKEQQRLAYTTLVGDVIFYPASEGQLWTHKDGKFLPLTTAFLAKKVSLAAVETAADSFNSYMDYWDRADPEDMEYAYFKYVWYKGLSDDGKQKYKNTFTGFAVKYEERLKQDGLVFP